MSATGGVSRSVLTGTSGPMTSSDPAARDEASPWAGPERGRRAGRSSASRRLDEGLRVLAGLIPLARRLTRLVGLYALVVGGAAAVIVTTLLWRFRPGSWAEGVLHLFVAVALLAPAVVLWLFQRALVEVVELPERLAAMPSVARDHGAELADLVREVRARRDRPRAGSAPRDLWRAGRLLLAAHDDLPGYGAVLTLVSVPFLVVTALAALGGLVVVLAAPAVVVGAVASVVL